MSDFHTAIDRALEEHDDLTVNRYFMPEPLENPSGIPALPGMWAELGYIDETWEPTNVRLIQDSINRRVIERLHSELANPYGYRAPLAIDSTTAYDSEPSTLDWVDDFDAQWAALNWREPARLTIEARFVSVETIELAVGQNLLPLCDRPLPSRGTE